MVAQHGTGHRQWRMERRGVRVGACLRPPARACTLMAPSPAHLQWAPPLPYLYTLPVPASGCSTQLYYTGILLPHRSKIFYYPVAGGGDHDGVGRRSPHLADGVRRRDEHPGRGGEPELADGAVLGLQVLGQLQGAGREEEGGGRRQGQEHACNTMTTGTSRGLPGLQPGGGHAVRGGRRAATNCRAD